MSSWEVEGSDEFAVWYEGLNDDECESVNRVVALLVKHGPVLGRPHADLIHHSRIPHLKELRVQHEGRPYRILYVFDPRRCAYLILGGDKTGDDRWYDKYVPLAEAIYERHLAEIGCR